VSWAVGSFWSSIPKDLGCRWSVVLSAIRFSVTGAIVNFSSRIGAFAGSGVAADFFVAVNVGWAYGLELEACGLGLLGLDWVAVWCYLTCVDLALLSNRSVGLINPYQIL
jgi:hypothetical protein